MRKNAFYIMRRFTKGEWLKMAVLTIMFLIVTIINSQTFAMVREFNRVIQVAKQMELEDKYFNMCVSFFHDVDFDEILALDSVANLQAVNTFAGSNATFKDGYTIDDLQRRLDSYDGEIFYGDDPLIHVDDYFFIAHLANDVNDFSSINPIRTIDGELIDSLQPNQIILDETASDKYEIGDRITFAMDSFDWDGEKPLFFVSPCEVEVVGFISRDEYILTSGYSPICLDYMFTSLGAELDFNGEWLKENLPDINIYGCIASYFEFDGQYYNYENECPNSLIITKSTDASYEDLCNDLESVDIDVSDLPDYQSIYEQYQIDFRNKLRASLNYEIVAVFVALAIVAGIFVDWYTNRKDELIIYRLCGCTWREGMLYSIIPYMLPLVLGILGGAILWNLYCRIDDTIHRGLGVGFYAIFLLISIAVYSLAAFIYYMISRKKSADELYRSKG